MKEPPLGGEPLDGAGAAAEDALRAGEEGAATEWEAALGWLAGELGATAADEAGFCDAGATAEEVGFFDATATDDDEAGVCFAEAATDDTETRADVAIGTAEMV